MAASTTAAAGWPFGANTATSGLDAVNIAPQSADSVGIGVPQGAVPIDKLEVRVTDASTTQQLEATAIAHQVTAATGPPVSPFSIGLGFYLANSAHTTTRAGQVRSSWITATAGVETSSIDLLASSAGTFQVAGKFNGAGYLELPTQNAGLTALKFSSAGDQEFQKNGGNLGMGAQDNHDVYFFTGNTVQLKIMNRAGAANNADIVLGTFTSLANNATQGFVYVPVSATTGAPSGTPSFAGASAAHAALFYNIVDNKLWVHNQTAWKSVTLA